MRPGTASATIGGGSDVTWAGFIPDQAMPEPLPARALTSCRNRCVRGGLPAPECPVQDVTLQVTCSPSSPLAQWIHRCHRHRRPYFAGLCTQRVARTLHAALMRKLPTNRLVAPASTSRTASPSPAGQQQEHQQEPLWGTHNCTDRLPHLKGLQDATSAHDTTAMASVQLGLNRIHLDGCTAAMQLLLQSSVMHQSVTAA